MTEDVLIGIDLGTTGCRAALWSSDGVLVAEHYVESSLRQTHLGAAEQDAEGWWRQTLLCLRECLQQAPAARELCRGVAVSAQGHSWVPVDAEERPLRAAFTWLDTRAQGQAERVTEQIGAARLGEIAGKVAGPWHMLPQLLWLRDHDPELVNRAGRYSMALDFVTKRLCGRAAADYTIGAGTLLLDIVRRQWSADLLAEFDISAERLPELQPAGTVAGKLEEDLARELELPAGLPVVVGAQDQKCAALAAGVGPSIATVSLGTATAITLLVDRPACDPAAGIPCFPYLFDASWALEAPVVTTGGSLRWLRDLFNFERRAGLTFEQLDEMAARSPPGANGVHFCPFLAGAGAPHWRHDAEGAFVGLKLSTGVDDLARAVLEGVAFEIRSAMDAMTGADLQGVRLFGGGARSEVWPQIIADVVGCTVEVSAEAEMSALGAAMLAAGATVYGSLQEAQQRMAQPVRAYPSDRDRAGEYDVLFAHYCGHRERLWGGD